MTTRPTTHLPDGTEVCATVVLWAFDWQSMEIAWRAVNRYAPEHDVDKGSVKVLALEHPQNRLDRVIAVVNERGHSSVDQYIEEPLSVTESVAS